MHKGEPYIQHRNAVMIYEKGAKLLIAKDKSFFMLTEQYYSSDLF